MPITLGCYKTLQWGGGGGLSLEPRLSIPDFVLQLWRKIDFSPKLRDKIWNGKPGFKARGGLSWWRDQEVTKYLGVEAKRPRFEWA